MLNIRSFPTSHKNVSIKNTSPFQKLHLNFTSCHNIRHSYAHFNGHDPVQTSVQTTTARRAPLLFNMTRVERVAKLYHSYYTIVLPGSAHSLFDFVQFENIFENVQSIRCGTKNIITSSSSQIISLFSSKFKDSRSKRASLI